MPSIPPFEAKFSRLESPFCFAIHVYIYMDRLYHLYLQYSINHLILNTNISYYKPYIIYSINHLYIIIYSTVHIK